jgi:hypothetical protein
MDAGWWMLNSLKNSFIMSVNDSIKIILGLLCIGYALKSVPDQTPSSVCMKVPESAILQAGDLIFIEGSGYLSELFRNCARRDRSYSHAGIVVRTETDSLVIAHMEMVKQGDSSDFHLESIQSFISTSRSWGIYRLPLTVAERQAIAQYALYIQKRQPSFDMSFNANDTTEFYCTELLMHAINCTISCDYIKAGTAINGGNYIAPDDIFLLEDIELIEKHSGSSTLLAKNK